MKTADQIREERGLKPKGEPVSAEKIQGHVNIIMSRIVKAPKETREYPVCFSDYSSAYEVSKVFIKLGFDTVVQEGIGGTWLYIDW